MMLHLMWDGTFSSTHVFSWPFTALGEHLRVCRRYVNR